MSDQAEIDRVNHTGLGPTLPDARWSFKIDLGLSPDDVWIRVIDVIQSIVAYNYDSWPNDDYWKTTLPKWLSSSMITEEEARVAMARTPRGQWDELPWEFGSWLEAIRERDWKWWGYERSGNEVLVVLEVTGVPPRISAFKQILLASGAQILSEESTVL
ncbi:hypothetical protein [Bradyrhizobium sp. BR 1433]|uniref:hypothetical protein n=1 Tax=Bradyrhizobium sp. BR 1433 TaxID=3447967 RepID=UPI003EE51EBC